MLMPLDTLYDTGGGPLPAADFAQPGFDGVFVDGVPYAGAASTTTGAALGPTSTCSPPPGVEPRIPDNFEDLIAMLQQLTLDANGNNAASPDFDPDNVVQWGTSIGEWPYTDFESYLAQFGGQHHLGRRQNRDREHRRGHDGPAAHVRHDLRLITSRRPRPASTPGRAGRAAWSPSSRRAPGSATSPPTRPDISYQAMPQFQVGPQPGTLVRPARIHDPGRDQRRGTRPPSPP